MRLTGWKKLFPGAHIEGMRGYFASNTAYCSKEGQLIQHGQPPRQEATLAATDADLDSILDVSADAEAIRDLEKASAVQVRCSPPLDFASLGIHFMDMETGLWKIDKLSSKFVTFVLAGKKATMPTKDGNGTVPRKLFLMNRSSRKSPPTRRKKRYSQSQHPICLSVSFPPGHSRVWRIGRGKETEKQMRC